MSADIYVAFGGDTAALETALARAQASVKATTAEMRTLANQMEKTGASADSQMGQSLAALGAKLAGVKSSVAGFKSELSGSAAPVAALNAEVAKTGGHAISAGVGLGFYMREARAMADELASGRYRQFDGSLINFAVHGAQAAASFAQANPQLIAFGAAALAAAAAIGYLAYQQYEANNALKSIELSAAVDEFRLGDQAASALRDSIEKLANVGASDAAAIAKPFLELGPAGAVVAQLVATTLPQLADHMGKKLPEAADEVAKRFTELATVGKKYIDNSTLATAATKAQFDAFVAAGEKTKAYGLIIDVMNASLPDFKNKADQASAALADQRLAAMAAASGMNALAIEEADGGTILETTTAKINTQSAALGVLRGQLDGAASSARNMAQALQSGLAEALKVDKVTGEIARTKAEIATLDAGMNAAGDKSSPAINAMSRSLAIAEDNLKKLHEEASDGLLGRDASAKFAENNRLLADSYKGPQTGLLTQQRENAQKVASDPTVSAKEREAAELEVADKTKEIRAADYADFQAGMNLKVAAAGKNSAQVIAIRETEAAKAREVFGAGSNEERTAIEQVARAKEQAANRGAAAGAKAAKDELGASEQGIKGQISAIERATDATVEHYGAEVKLKQITEGQKVALVVAALTKEKAAVDQLYSQELALAGLSLTKKAEILTQEEAFNDKVALKMQEANEKAAEASEKAWKSASDKIAGAINGQVSGLLHGTTSMAQAFKNMAASMIEDAIKYCITWSIEHLATVTKNTLATAAGVTAQTSTLTAGAAAGAAAEKAANASTISGDASKAAAGAYASTTQIPIIGPILAPAAAAVAFGAVEAFGAFDIGAWSIPNDQMAMVHQNELVMPAAEAGAFRSMLSGAARGSTAGDSSASAGGDTHVHLNVSAMDGASAKSWLSTNAKHIASALHSAVRNGDHLGLKALART